MQIHKKDEKCFFPEVTIIPTYDTDVLGYWVAENEELLTELRIDLAPSASRCTINLQVSNFLMILMIKNVDMMLFYHSAILGNYSHFYCSILVC